MFFESIVGDFVVGFCQSEKFIEQLKLQTILSESFYVLCLWPMVFFFFQKIGFLMFFKVKTWVIPSQSIK